MNEFREVIKGLTDLPLAAESVVFACLLFRQNKKRAGGLFWLIALAAAMGVAAHIFALPRWGEIAFWVPLYGILFETVRQVAAVLRTAVSGTHTAGARIVFWAEGVLYAGAVAGLVWWEPYDMLFLVAFAVGQLTGVVTAALRARRLPGSVAVLTGLALTVAVLQALAGVIPYAVVLEHALLTVALWWFFRELCYKGS